MYGDWNVPFLTLRPTPTFTSSWFTGFNLFSYLSSALLASSHPHIPTGSFPGPIPPVCADPRQETHLGEHGCHVAQAFLALLLQVLLLVRPGLQAQVLQAVDILQEDIETLGLVGSPGFPHALYVVDHFLSGEKGKSFSG